MSSMRFRADSQLVKNLIVLIAIYASLIVLITLYSMLVKTR